MLLSQCIIFYEKMLTDATNKLKTSVSEGKSLIATAVTGKGVQTAVDATFQTMASNISSIPTGYKTMKFDNGRSGSIPTLSLYPYSESGYGTVDISSGSVTLYIYTPIGENNLVTFTFS